MLKLIYARKEVSLYIAIGLFAFILYANTLTHGFVFDDAAVLTANTIVQKGFGGLAEIFTTGSWKGFEPELDMHIYRPLQLTTLAVQYEIFGLKPFGYHLVQVCCYAILCALIFSLLRKLFSAHPGGLAISFLATLIYAAHPVHTEVVANIKGNGDLLALLFGILSLHSLYNFSEQTKYRHLAIGAFFFLLALLSKETIVSFVGVGALMLFFFSNNSLKRIIFSLIPMLMMVGLYLALRSHIFGEDSTRLIDTSEFSNVLMMADSLSQELGLRLYALGKNLQLVSIPYPLLMMYVYNSVPMVEFWDIRALFSLALYLVLGYAFIRHLKKGNIWGFAIGLYLATIALFSNTIFTIPNLLSERWLLAPSLGFCIAAAYACHRLHKLNRASAVTLALLLLFGYSGYTIERNLAWKSNLTLSKTDIKTAPESVIILKMLCVALENKAVENDLDPDILRELAFYLEELLELSQYDAAVNHKLGSVYEELGEYRRAAEAHGFAAKLVSPVAKQAARSQAVSLNLGGFYAEALPHWRTLHTENPADVHILSGLLVALKGTENDNEAQSIYESLISHLNARRTLQMDAQDYTWLNNLGVTLEQIGAYQLAAKVFGEAASYASTIQGNAAFSRAKNLNLAQLHAEAIPFWQDLDLKYPGLVDVKLGLTTAYIGAGLREEAERQILSLQTMLVQAKAKELSEEQAISINSIAVTLENWGAHEIAAGLFQKAASVDSSIRGKAKFSQAKNLNIAQSYERALPIWLELQKEYPSVPEVYLGKAEAHVALNQPRKAIEAYGEVIALVNAPDNGITDSHLRDKAMAKITELEAP